MWPPRVRVHKGRENRYQPVSWIWGSYPKRKISPYKGSSPWPPGPLWTCYTSRYLCCPQQPRPRFCTSRALSHAQWRWRSLWFPMQPADGIWFVHPRLLKSHVCMYVSMYVCMYVYMYVWMDACMHAWMHACMFMYMCTVILWQHMN